MERTKGRPLPAGRVAPGDALAFGLGISIAGLALLGLVNLLTLLLGAAALASYVLAYTPLKRVTSLCTVVGAIPGALPPLMGWAAARGSLGPAGWGLFAILFLWQLPHFLAIGWLYREDYARGGFPMLAVTDRDGSSTGRQAVLYATALLPVTLWAGLLAAAGKGYLWGALSLGVGLPRVRGGVRLESFGRIGAPALPRVGPLSAAAARADGVRPMSAAMPANRRLLLLLVALAASLFVSSVLFIFARAH